MINVIKGLYNLYKISEELIIKPEKYNKNSLDNIDNNPVDFSQEKDINLNLYYHFEILEPEVKEEFISEEDESIIKNIDIDIKKNKLDNLIKNYF